MGKFSLYSTSDLKGGADEGLAHVMDHFGYSQVHIYTFIRLAIQYTQVILAGALFYGDRKIGWNKIYNYVLAAVATYVVLSVVLYIWECKVEKKANYIGRKDGQLVYIRTASPKHSDEYKVTVLRDGQPAVEETLLFPQIFDLNGRIVHEKFRADIGQLIGAKKLE